MTIATLSTRHLVGLLVDVERTASTDPETPLLSAVLLHSDHGEWMFTKTDTTDPAMIDVWPTDLLVGTSTDGSRAGQAHIPSEGTLPRPVLLAGPDVKALIKFLRPFSGRAAKISPSHTVLELSGEILTVTETPSGRSVHMPVVDDDDYPARLACALLEADPTVGAPGQGDTLVEVACGTGVDPVDSAIVTAVAKRRKMNERWYRWHQRRTIVVEVGAAYRCAFQPVRLDEENWEHREPQVRVFTPPLPDGRTGTTEPALVDDDTAGL